MEDAIGDFVDPAVHDALCGGGWMVHSRQWDRRRHERRTAHSAGRILRRRPIAARFPDSGREVHGRKLVYLDNAASAQKPNHVLDAMNKFATSEYANVHRGVHYLSGAATERYEAARVRVQRFLNAAHADEIIFTRAAPKRSISSAMPISRR